MDSIEQNVQLLIDGKAINEPGHCDYSLKDQLEELAAKKIEPSHRDYKPICKETVCYIVASVLINENNQVLMMQEAKKECAGTWYLPAGRMEPGEDIYNAAQREITEETGLTCALDTLIMIENASKNWYRFVFTGYVPAGHTGGQLKTVSQADSESLQAAWIDDVLQLSLRSDDILPLIERAKTYWKERSTWHKPIIPAIKPHDKLLLRVLFVIRKKANNRLHVLVSENHIPHLPLCEISSKGVYASLKRFMQVVFGQNLPKHKPNGIIAVEHSGHPMNDKDGICLTFLISCKVPLENCNPCSGYTWLEVNPEMEVKLLEKLGKNKTITYSYI